MKTAMVISSLTIYAIAFTCFALLVGKSVANTSSPVDLSTRTGDRRGNKLQIPKLPKTEEKHDTPRVLQSHYIPSNTVKNKKMLSDEVKILNESHVYFALFDPSSNITRKFEVNNPGSQLPTRVATTGDFNLFHLNVTEVKENASAESESIASTRKSTKSKHPWDEMGKKGRVRNFIARDTLQDSETETRVHFNGITAKETMVKTGVDEETGKRKGLKLRQLTDGSHFIQMIYTIDDEIQDCEFIRQKKIVHKFLHSFRNEVEKAKLFYEVDEDVQNMGQSDSTHLENKQGNNRDNELDHVFGDDDDDEDDSYLEEDEGAIERYSQDEDMESLDGSESEYEFKNVSFQILEKDEDLPQDIAEWMDYKQLKAECKRTHRILKRLVHDSQNGDEHAKNLAKKHFERVRRGLTLTMIAPGTKWCGRSQVADKYTEIGGFSRTDKCCRAHDHCQALIPPFDKRYGYFNYRPFTLSHCRCDSRRKRDLMDMLRIPGTKWCGKGKRADKYTSLGGFSRADKCCRLHDTTCPFWIGGFEEKYGFFNWRINTIMHCRCDKRFRACLKMAKTGAANLVGKLFFNVVQTKCFVLKPKEVCLRKSWWGKCEKKEYKKQAYLKNNIPY